MKLRSLFVLAVLWAACGGKDPLPPLELDEGCQPLLNGADCLLPFPSDQFREKDDSLPSGYRIRIPQRAKVKTTAGLADPSTLHPIDGFARTSTMVAMFPTGVLPEGFANVNANPEDSMADGSASLIIDAASGERVPHFVDVDPRAKTPSRQALVLHPIVALKARTRYIVAIRSAKAPDGALITAPEGFRRLRDQEAKGDPVLEPLSARFDKEVFPALESAGLKRSELQLAWDFTTGSLELPRADMLRVRELTLAWLATAPKTFTVDSIEDVPELNVYKRIRGTFTAPLFVADGFAGAQLVRDADGKVARNGEVQVPYFVSIPKSVQTAGVTGKALFYGHGFFGGFGELGGGAARALSQSANASLIAAEWWGMSTSDVGVVSAGLTGKPNDTMKFTDRVHQGMANWLVLEQVSAAFGTHPAFQLPGAVPAFGAPRAYLGISQGHILGGVLIPMTQNLDRVVLQVGGSSFTTMMMRAQPFGAYMFLMETTIRDALEQQKYIALLQAPFDRVDPAAYADLFFENPLPSTPTDRRVLMQYGLGDTSVPNIGTTLHARQLGMKVLTPAPTKVFGLQEITGPVDGSAVAIYDFGVDVAKTYAVATPPEIETDVHGTVRTLSSAQTQIRTFIETGRIVHACVGVCDPE